MFKNLFSKKMFFPFCFLSIAVFFLSVYFVKSSLSGNNSNSINVNKNINTEPSERAVIVTTKILEYTSEKEREDSIREWGNGDRYATIKNYALYLDKNPSILVARETEIAQYEARMNNRAPSPSVQRPQPVNTKKTCTKCSTNYLGEVVCSTYESYVCY